MGIESTQSGHNAKSHHRELSPFLLSEGIFNVGLNSSFDSPDQSPCDHGDTDRAILLLGRDGKAKSYYSLGISI